MACKPAMKSTKSEKSAEFASIFSHLKKLMSPYAPRLHVAQDTETVYYLETTKPVYKGKPIMFGAVRQGKAYVSYHLFPLYMNPELAKKVSPELKRRMQGKTCFNFNKPDEKLFEELAILTAGGFDCFKQLGAKLQANSAAASRAK